MGSGWKVLRLWEKLDWCDVVKYNCDVVNEIAEFSEEEEVEGVRQRVKSRVKGTESMGKV